MSIESTELDFFNEERVNFIKNLAGHASISIQNARLLQERQTQIEILSGLRKLSVDLSNTVDPNKAYPLILQAALAVLHAQDTQLINYHSETQTLNPLASLSQDTTPLNQKWLPDEILMEIVRGGKTRVVTKSEAEIPEPFDTIIITLIKRENIVHEILCAAYRQPISQIKDECNKIELLAFQVSGHLGNFKLYAQIRANNNRMRAILDSTRDGILLLGQ